MSVESGYQDAWNTPGWTAQWDHLPDATVGSPGYYDVELPDGLSKLSITGTFYDQYGAAWGSLLFMPSVRSITVDGAMVSLEPFRVWLRGGKIPERVAIPQPSPDSDSDPAEFSWHVTGRVGPASFDKTVTVPGESDTYDLNTGWVPNTSTT